MEIKLIEIAGMRAALSALRLLNKENTGSVCEGNVQSGSYASAKNGNLDIEASDDGMKLEAKVILKAVRSDFIVAFSPEDIELISRNVLEGISLNRFTKGIVVWTEIAAPRWWWCEIGYESNGHSRISAEEGFKNEVRKTVDCFTYKKLREIWFRMHNDNREDWKRFCKWIETLPFADEFILKGIKEEHE